jgi:hypothetical protein
LKASFYICQDNNAKTVQPVKAAAPKKKEESSGSSESDSESDSDSDEVGSTFFSTHVNFLLCSF